MRIIIYNGTVYRITEKQFDAIQDVKDEASRLPFGGDMHIEEHLNNCEDNYKPVGEIDLDADSLLYEY